MRVSDRSIQILEEASWITVCPIWLPSCWRRPSGAVCHQFGDLLPHCVVSCKKPKFLQGKVEYICILDL